MKTLSLIIIGLLTLTVSENTDRVAKNASTNNFELVCSNFDRNGIQKCIAGINSGILNIVASDRQRANQWCWAASIEAVLNYYGYNITQEDIVYQTWGQIRNMPGTPSDILSALNKTYIDRDGYEFTVIADSYTANHVTAAQDLASNNPLIIGTQGHAMVLTSLEYYRDKYGNGQVVNAIVRDPWPYSPGRRTLSSKEWYETSLLVRIRVD